MRSVTIMSAASLALLTCSTLSAVAIRVIAIKRCWKLFILTATRWRPAPATTSYGQTRRGHRRPGISRRRMQGGRSTGWGREREKLSRYRVA
uniref:Putative secreted protein n=1 Tax=Ixodes ricinus TaxID=34613 RepID=A0A6B0U208_IXORI